MSLACFQIDQIPDLTLNKYQSLADTGVGGVLNRHESFLRQWHGICTASKTSFHLLYCYLPSEPIGQRLKAYFLLQGNDDALQVLEPLLKKSPLSDFFTFKKGELPSIGMKAGATLTKKEIAAPIQNPVSGQLMSVHHVPKWETNGSARLYDLFRIMETVGQAYSPQEACAFRIDLYPVSAAEDTRKAFTPVIKSLRGENEIKLMRETESLSRDNYAREVCRVYEDWLTDIEASPTFRANIYAFADNAFKANVLLNAAGSEALNEGDFSVITALKPDENGAFQPLSRIADGAMDYCRYPQAALKSWATTFCLPEVVPFFRLPTLYDGETIEIPKETAPKQVENGIYLGEDTNGYPVNIALGDLPRHAFFTGMPGSGKTNTMLHLVTQLHKNDIPFLAMEPAKKEYRAMLGHEEMRDVHLFSPHLQSKFPLQMNPMEFPVGVRLSDHINALIEVFQGSFILEGAVYRYLSSSIQRAYTELEWDIEETRTEDCTLPFPTLQDVYDILEEEVNASSYDDQIKGNLRSFLQVRLGSLMERDAGELFNVPVSTVKPDDWLNISAIVELEVLGEQAKNFFVLLVCHYIFETLRANPSGGVDSNGNPKPVRHVIFIEEAHNIIASSSEQASADLVNPKVAATAYIMKMLAEVRALRESIVIADQLPTALSAEVTKNTGLKLVHRLTAKDDREEIGTAISASAVQLERMASFTKGRAFIYHENTMKPFEMQVAEWVKPKVAYDLTNDTQLYSELWRLPSVEWAAKTAFDNWKEKNLCVLVDKIAECQKQLRETPPQARWKFVERRSQLASECALCIAQCQRLKKLWIPNNSVVTALSEEINTVLAELDVAKQCIILS